ncbi:plant/protein (Protein of unknown function, DUF538) [Thalictrum thalictroides]|uniref:DUF538 family protein n=1 Tax=Thalictrum thalictroides TaxID=46969 RepID=A0A7J6W2R5_THATH|nr:plant/protein (Protein of unknown function, DUF538) [Thalictrum thalictroides]
MVLITEEIRAKAMIVYGDEIGQEKTVFLLQEVGLPTGLLPLKDIIECGYVEETGFVWLKQKKKIEHKFQKVGRQVIYGTDITAYVEKYKIKKLTGVKVKELMVWVTLGDIVVEDPENGKITFRSPTGLFRTFPASAFDGEGPVREIKEPMGVLDKKNTKETNEVKEGMVGNEDKKEAILAMEGMVVNEVKEAILAKE